MYALCALVSARFGRSCVSISRDGAQQTAAKHPMHTKRTAIILKLGVFAAERAVRSQFTLPARQCTIGPPALHKGPTIFANKQTRV